MRYRESSGAQQAALLKEGIVLARNRHAALHDLIVRDPERALALSVPVAVRRMLPAQVDAELETRVAGNGDLAVQCALTAAGAGRPGEEQRVGWLGGRVYRAHTYGRRQAQATKYGASFHGIALDGELAVHESPLHVLEPAELGTPNTESGAPWVEAHGKVFAVENEAALEAYAIALEAAESRRGPDVAPLLPHDVKLPPTERLAEATTAWTTGTKQVLVLRVDFSDRPGDPVATATAQNVMDQSVAPFFRQSSYGRSTLVTTVSSGVYRLPRTVASYASDTDASGAGNYMQLHRDATDAAAADYTIANYDRVIVVFSSSQSVLGGDASGRFVGRADIGATRVWIENGANFGFRVTAHELGHTYGLQHANLWHVDDGNVVSPSGRSEEYGDLFDVMGSPDISVTATHDFNPWYKNQLGWLPDSAVRTITSSGTYRVYRFDHVDANGNTPLALRIYRDGVHWYWLSLRQSETSNLSLTNGLYVTWGFNGRMQKSLVLDATTPGASAFDAVIPAGTTFADEAYGIGIRPGIRDGVEPNQYVDVQITLRDTSEPTLAAWGRDTVGFYDANTGKPTNPRPEVFPPHDLGEIVAIAGGSNHALALKPDGSVVAWGLNTSGQCNVPAMLRRAVAVVASTSNFPVSGVLQDDGQFVAWGDSRSPILSIPAGLGNVRQVSLSDTHALALKWDGTVVAWGETAGGALDVPTGLTNITAVAAGFRGSAVLRSDGTVVTWGNFASSKPANLGGVAALAASSSPHFLALKHDGTVVAWGSNTDGQVTVPVGLTDVVSIAAAGSMSMALKSDGSVVTWGNPRFGATNVPRALPRAYAIGTSSTGCFALVGSRPMIITQPVSTSASVGSDVVLRVVATAIGSVSYQWRRNGTAIPGATSSTLTLGRISPADLGAYDVVVMQGAFSMTSALAWVTQAGPLAIATHPRGQTLPAGATFTLSVQATGGSGIYSYQWRLNGVAISGATSASLTRTLLSSSTGNYDVIVSDGTSSLTSAVASLVALQVGRISNLSIRTRAGNGAEMLIVGFAVGPTPVTKTLLIRGVGPSLTQFGLTGVLADPKIELFEGSNKIVENDNWGNNTQVRDAAMQVGAFALLTSSRDAALLRPGIGLGTYSVQISGVGDTTGIALAEIYDTAASVDGLSSRLTNISARATVGTGADILIAGFAIAGPGSKRVLIRAVGPTLSAFGLNGVLSDPKLEVFRGAVKLDENDNWSSVLGEAFSSVGAFALPSGSKDAALILTLPAGSYTVQVSGVGATVGLVLVEIYEMP